KRDDAAALQPGIQMLARAIVGRLSDVGTEDRAHGARAGRWMQVFDVFAIGADIADMREGECDDLPGIGGIREDFLVAGERSVKANLANGGAGGAKARPLDDSSVCQHQKRRDLAYAPRAACSRHLKSPIFQRRPK